MSSTPDKKPGAAAEPKLPPTVIELLAEEEDRERRWMRMALGIALVLHVMIFMIHWPSFAGSGSEAAKKKTKIYVVKQVKFKPPEKPKMQDIPKPKTRIVPIPDPTPDEPEPIREEEPQEDLDFVPDQDLVMGIPEAPPPPEPEGPVRFVVGGNITEPVKISAPAPRYPEAARRARIQGAVILELTIDKRGTVKSAKVLRGLPLGCTDAAVEAVNKWRFKPSTLNGKPVEVIYVLTVRFSLQ